MNEDEVEEEDEGFGKRYPVSRYCSLSLFQTANCLVIRFPLSLGGCSSSAAWRTRGMFREAAEAVRLSF